MINRVVSPPPEEHSAWNIICELYSKQMKSGSLDNSLKSSGTEMSLTTSNIWWHWCRNIWQLQSNCILKAFPNESVTPRTWNTLKRHSAQSIEYFFICLYVVNACFIVYVFFSVVAAGSRSSECAERHLTYPMKYISRYSMDFMDWCVNFSDRLIFHLVPLLGHHFNISPNNLVYDQIPAKQMPFSLTCTLIFVAISKC